MKKLIITMFISLFLMIGTASATTGVEFLRADWLKQFEIIEPLIVRFVEQGYKNVPNWYNLEEEMEKLIRKKGLATEDVYDISLEAAKALGMIQKPIAPTKEIKKYPDGVFRNY